MFLSFLCRVAMKKEVIESELQIADVTIGKLLDEIDDLKEILAGYGGHLYPCQADGGKCFCGWHDIVDEFDLHPDD